MWCTLTSGLHCRTHFMMMWSIYEIFHIWTAMIILHFHTWLCITAKELTKCWFLIGSRAKVRLTCWKQGRIVWKPINTSPGLNFFQIITFSSIQMFFAALFCVSGENETQNSKPDNKHKTSMQSYKTQIKFSLFLG